MASNCRCDSPNIGDSAGTADGARARPTNAPPAHRSPRSGRTRPPPTPAATPWTAAIRRSAVPTARTPRPALCRPGPGRAGPSPGRRTRSGGSAGPRRYGYGPAHGSGPGTRRRHRDPLTPPILARRRRRIGRRIAARSGRQCAPRKRGRRLPPLLRPPDPAATGPDIMVMASTVGPRLADDAAAVEVAVGRRGRQVWRQAWKGPRMAPCIGSPADRTAQATVAYQLDPIDRICSLMQ